ncbi:hypothetical protein [Parafrankia elaeagni]|uniref:hypothetical protein n=1 Tax=Parafrankia elaeagni TaxID=222534 RepID=UPI0003656BA6|nr:hypothetical protein [Parafrankia elaeagni]
MIRVDRAGADPLAFLDEAARVVSDTVLYEGYLLYPYRADALKNQHHWQFGVLMPPAAAAPGSGEHSSAHTEFLLDGPADARLEVGVRWLWEEGDATPGSAAPASAARRGEAAVGFAAQVDDLLAAPTRRKLAADGPNGRRGEVLLDAQRLPGPFGGFRVRATIRNTSALEPASVMEPPADTRLPGTDERDAALATAFLGVQLAARTNGGSFLSLADPPEWAADAARACVNERLWPALLGQAGPADTTVLADTVLAAPIILPDHPRIAAESPAPFCDATEIDEMLALRTSTLTDAERQGVRATDPRAADLLDAVAELAPAMVEKLHGRTTVTPPGVAGTPGPAPPAHLAPGGEVRIRPRPGGVMRTDAQDMFVDGAAATVAAVLHDVDGRTHVAVTLDDDPGADLRREFGRFLYFTPDELEAR